MNKRASETDIKRAYLVKVCGSMGCIYDFSNVHIFTETELQNEINSYGAKESTIKYAYYDERINFHKWHILNEEGHHLLWLLSQTKDVPWLSEWSVMDEGM